MVEINKINARIYAKLGQSGTIFGMSLLDEIKIYPDIFVLASDMSRTAGIDRFKTQYPGNFFNVGIAEQNLIGIASGLSSEGKTVIVTTQATFISMRSYEQLRQYLGYMQHKVIVIGIGAGFTLTFLGNTHYAIEDISISRTIPQMTVLSPSDAGQAAKIFEAAIKLNSPVYIRLVGGLNCPIVYKEDYELEIGKSIVIKDGEDITVFATGIMVYNSLKAAELLEKENISVKTVDVHTIKPLDRQVIKDSLSSKLFVSVEEHSIIGGLGSAISEYLAEQGKTAPLLRLGVKDTFSVVGNYEYLLAQHRLTPELIAEDILHKYNSLR
ncbi:MAG: transketolase [Prevotellaceae bacterium]|jgi:transketolase|nr:transketolase [Prevotellaceae bacterium]